MFTLDGGKEIERGEMVNPSTGVLEAYEESVSNLGAPTFLTACALILLPWPGPIKINIDLSIF
jgi:hypothetical protein